MATRDIVVDWEILDSLDRKLSIIQNQLRTLILEAQAALDQISTVRGRLQEVYELAHDLPSVLEAQTTMPETSGPAEPAQVEEVHVQAGPADPPAAGELPRSEIPLPGPGSRLNAEEIRLAHLPADPPPAVEHKAKRLRRLKGGLHVASCICRWRRTEPTLEEVKYALAVHLEAADVAATAP